VKRVDAALFTQMLSDRSLTDLKKLGYKYPQADMGEFIQLLKSGFYKTLPLKDFQGENIIYLDSVAQVHLSAAKLLLTPQSSTRLYGLKAMEEEIVSTLSIEQIDTSRASVRKILSGYAPDSESENRILGMKKGLEFISDPQNEISEENLYLLYQMAVGDFLPEEDRLLPGNRYRHDAVYVVGDKVEHAGLPWQKLNSYLSELISFIHGSSDCNDLLTAALIHFYIAYLHPWFDGNGRMARLIHLWYLVQQGYSSALFVPLSGFVEKSRKDYYDAYTLTEENAKISGVLDVTPFLVYFIENVYHKLGESLPAPATTDAFQAALEQGSITEKERDLWQFVLSAYGSDEFSTKQLERDFGRAAYATIRSFVLKFEKLGLLRSRKYGNRTKYCAAK
jgi:Fic family protein